MEYIDCWGCDPGSRTAGLAQVRLYDDGKIQILWSAEIELGDWEQVAEWILRNVGDPLFIEDFFARHQNKSSQMPHRTIGAVVRSLAQQGRRPELVDNATWRAYCLDLAMVRKMPDLEWLGEHESDAIRIAIYGAHALRRRMS